MNQTAYYVYYRLRNRFSDALESFWQRYGDALFIALGFALAFGVLVLIGLSYPAGRVVQG